LKARVGILGHGGVELSTGKRWKKRGVTSDVAIGS